MPNAVNSNRKGCNPPAAAARRRSAAGKQTGSTQQSATFIPSESAIPKVASSPSLTCVGTTSPAKTASAPTPTQANKLATPTAAAAPKPPPTAPKPAPSAQTPPATAQTPPAVVSNPAGAVHGAKASSSPPGVVAIPDIVCSPSTTPGRQSPNGSVPGSPVKPAIRLEKETQEQVLAAIEDHAGDDDSSALICIQPSQSEVNIDEQKKLQHLPVVKAFNEAEKKKMSQRR
ncbi:unnamed protein product [Haemonchus placei]|uniref:Polyhomeotic-like protein 2 n=1 Tax=Haemonchus placei TaxID=6290 RepID=A0A0N4WYV6_HAEPC|nr:unnamed protein product [Haemonchus placei]